MNTTPLKVTPQEVIARKNEGDDIHLVDVRTPCEFDALHVEGAKLFPLDRFDTIARDSSLGLKTAGAGTSKPLYLLCQRGARASQAAEKLMRRGYWNVHVVDGGTERWAQSGLPVIRGKSAG